MRHILAAVAAICAGTAAVAAATAAVLYIRDNSYFY